MSVIFPESFILLRGVKQQKQTKTTLLSFSKRNKKVIYILMIPENRLKWHKISKVLHIMRQDTKKLENIQLEHGKEKDKLDCCSAKRL